VTPQDKLIKQLYRLTVRMSEDVDYLLSRVHEFGPNTPDNQRRVARRVVGIRADVEKLKSIADSSLQVPSRGSK